MGQVSNSHGSVKTVGGAVEDPVPDSFSDGADKTTWRRSHHRLVYRVTFDEDIATYVETTVYECLV